MRPSAPPTSLNSFRLSARQPTRRTAFEVNVRQSTAPTVAFLGEGAERRWVRQAVMGVLRWRDLPGARTSIGQSGQRPAEVNLILSISLLLSLHYFFFLINTLDHLIRTNPYLFRRISYAVRTVPHSQRRSAHLIPSHKLCQTVSGAQRR